MIVAHRIASPEPRVPANARLGLASELGVLIVLKIQLILDAQTSPFYQ